MSAEKGERGDLYQKQIAEFRSKYGPKRQVIKNMWTHQPPPGILTYPDHCAELWHKMSLESRRHVINTACQSTVHVAQQMMPTDDDKRKMSIIIQTCLHDVFEQAESAAAKPFKEPGGLMELCIMILDAQENSVEKYPNAHIENFLARFDFDVFNELLKDSDKHRLMMKEFRSMYAVEWLIFLIAGFR